MSDSQWAVIINRPGYDPVRVGPLSEPAADTQAADFRMQLTGTQHVPGTTITTGPYDPSHPHLGPVLMDSFALADAVLAEPPSPMDGTNFPDLYSRLRAQDGSDRAREVWGRALDIAGAIEEEQLAEQAAAPGPDTDPPVAARCENPECPHDRAQVLLADTGEDGNDKDPCPTCNRLLVAEPHLDAAAAGVRTWADDSGRSLTIAQDPAGRPIVFTGDPGDAPALSAAQMLDVADLLAERAGGYLADRESGLVSFGGTSDGGARTVIRPAEALLTRFVDSLAAHLDGAGAVDYAETVFQDGAGRPVAYVLVQRPGRLTAHQLRRQAEDERDAIDRAHQRLVKRLQDLGEALPPGEARDAVQAVVGDVATAEVAGV